MFRRLLPLTLLLVTGLAGCSSAPPAPSLTVLAAASLVDVLPRLHVEPSVRYSFGASSLLVQQVLHGAPVDVLLTADMESQAPLKAAGLLAAGYPRPLLSNRLVLIGGPGLTVGSVHDLGTVPLHHLAACEPAVPIGRYARQAVADAGLQWSQLPVVTVGDVRAVLAAVDSGAADAGFVYRTDAAGLRHAHVLLNVPGIQAVYGESILHDSPAARAYERDLQSPENQSRLHQDGFDSP